MPKKTRQEKKMSDQRRIQPAGVNEFSYRFAPPNQKTNILPVNTISYIKTDILKTIIVGTLFICAQIALYFLLKTRGL